MDDGTPLGLGAILMEARRRLKLSKAEVVRRCAATRPPLSGWHERALSFWEASERVPSLPQFAILADVLALSQAERLHALQVVRDAAAVS